MTSLAQEPARFTNFASLPSREMAWEILASTGSYWRVEASPDLIQWASLLSFQSTGTDAHTDAAAPYLDHRFYRTVAVAPPPDLTGDHLATALGDAVFHPVDHASLSISWNDGTLYVDPMGGATPYQALPRADLILVTHQHGDHFHAGTLEAVRDADTLLLVPQALFGSLSVALKARAGVLANGASTNLLDLSVETQFKQLVGTDLGIEVRLRDAWYD